jgi:hypothetical protein
MGIQRFSKIRFCSGLYRHRLFEFPRFSSYTFHHSSVNFCGRTKCLGALKRYFNREYNKKQEKQQQPFFFTWGHLKWNYPINIFLIFFKLRKLVEDYYLLLPSKPLEGDFCFFRKYYFLANFWFTSEITHFRGVLIRKIKKNLFLYNAMII